MGDHDSDEIWDVSEFNQFRMSLVALLRLPPDVSESGLCTALEKCSPKVLGGYLARVQRMRAKFPANDDECELTWPRSNTG
jgi:hypothetical protein